LTDRGSEYCGNPERHEYELYLAVEDIDHSRTKTKSPQTNGNCERFHKTVLNEFYRIAFRKKVYRSIDELQVDLDLWVREYNEARPHQGRWCFGKTPMQTFLDAIPMTKEKMIRLRHRTPKPDRSIRRRLSDRVPANTPSPNRSRLLRTSDNLARDSLPAFFNVACYATQLLLHAVPVVAYHVPVDHGCVSLG
jgi:hypothetical protein